MAQPNAVEIVEVCKVAPPPAAISVPSPKSLPLTFFDIRWLRLPPYEILFFYEVSTPNSSSSFFFDSILPRLKHSLSLALLHFLPLAGNITWPPTSPKPGVEYSDGVLMTVAMSNDADFCRLSGSDIFCEATEYHPLIPKLSASHERVAVLALQVTLFPNQGFSIGIIMHHAVLDGKSLHMFLKSWAYICRSLGYGDCIDGQDQSTIFLQLPSELKPVYDRDCIKDPADLGTIFSNQWRNIDGLDNRSLVPWEVQKIQPGSVRGTFQMPREKIEKLKRLVRDKKMENDKDNEQQFPIIHVSTFSLTYAYMLACLAKAEEVIDDNISFVFVMDLRSRFEPPIPKTYFGNCVADKVTVVEREALLGKEGLIVALRAISEAIKGLEKGPLNGAQNWVSSDKLKASALKTYSIASSPRFEAYSTDFGWGRPRKVDVSSIDKTGAISLSDNRNGNGVEIGLVLRKHHMEAFASLFAEGLESL
ncbi:hypothetical protein TIFTF001_035003 [Ficus carica]|uniref:Uncharacterized protein n=1 Tax=Ficus carica TaxID=3494 RepID=A0AA88E4R4_FICCA|nr:hypothetical protein TIFTF001_034590 [Ficus carica]GMN65535.1 hypothetical protein TIFTF001_034605 [Ficus carica]GMN65926.1 hypothetical protein TIFTF001_034990 [Ficus carica]GMN65931.1 hypothetical protein TIFTF001_035003 [Ficus carica]